MRRRLAVTAVMITALAGEWLGHSLAYYRVAGMAGLRGGLGGPIHSYMVPLALALIVGGAAGAAAWVRAWLALGRRLDRSAAALAAQWRGRAPAHPPAAASRSHSARSAAPSPAARAAALALPLALLQVMLYLTQENLERSGHGLPAVGLSPLTDGYGAAVWIQAGVAVALAVVWLAALRLLRTREHAAELCERLAGVLRRRRRQHCPPAPVPVVSHVTSLQLRLRSALWQRPPPAFSAA